MASSSYRFRPVRAALVVAIGLGVSMVVAAPVAAAPPPPPKVDPKADLQEKQACVDASEEAQKLRSQGQLQKARERFVTCARETCPNVVRKDCSEWLVEIERQIPSLVVVAKVDGKDAADAHISIDDKPVPVGTEGRAYPVDPGQHHVVVTTRDGLRADETIVVREGEQQRVVNVGITTKAEAPARTGTGARKIPTSAWIATGVAGAGLASFAIFGIMGRSEVSNMRSTCAPDCEQSAVDAAHTKLVVADVSLGVGIVAAGVATWLFLSAPRDTGDKGVSLAVQPLANGGGFARLQGVF